MLITHVYAPPPLLLPRQTWLLLQDLISPAIIQCRRVAIRTCLSKIERELLSLKGLLLQLVIIVTTVIP